METFTKHEIDWILEAVKLTGKYYKTHSVRCGGVESSLAVLRAEQLSSIADKLNRALEAGSRRIAIKY